jgi:hypothetical protein
MAARRQHSLHPSTSYPRRPKTCQRRWEQDDAEAQDKGMIAMFNLTADSLTAISELPTCRLA